MQSSKKNVDIVSVKRRVSERKIEGENEKNRAARRAVFLPKYLEEIRYMTTELPKLMKIERSFPRKM